MKKDGFTAAIGSIERKIGYTFRDKSLCRQAFTRSSWCNEHPDEGFQSNEVLEFFGDSVLSVAIISFLLSESTERCERGIKTALGEGDFSNIKSKLSDKTNLSASTAKLGLEEYLLVGEGDAKLGIKSEPSVMEDLFESIIGAVYIDSDKDLKMVTKVVTNMLDMSVYSDSSAASVSPKNALQEWCADKKRRLPPPVYKTVSESGPDHKKEYERGVYVGERLLATAKGKNLKTADSLAAKEALSILMSESKGQKAQAEPASRSSEKPVATKPEAKSKKAQTEAAPRAGGKPSTARPEANAERASKSVAAPVLAISEDGVKGEKKKPTKSLSASARLRAEATKRSVAGPVFRDLGLIAEDEHCVECSFLGQRAIASAPTRAEAKERAAENIRDALGIK